MKAPPASCYAKTIDLTSQGFSADDNFFAMLIHDLLSPDECDSLLRIGKAEAADQWHPVTVDTRLTDPRVRHVYLCDRFMWDDASIADVLWSRIELHLPRDIRTLHDRPEITTEYDSDGPSETWGATRLHERLRLLRYAPCNWKRSNFDAHYVAPGDGEASFLVVYVYLGGSDDLQGGAMSFLALNEEDEIVLYEVDMPPGSCLVFQRHYLTHSVQEVTRGTKYTLRTDVVYRKVTEDVKLEAK